MLNIIYMHHTILNTPSYSKENTGNLPRNHRTCEQFPLEALQMAYLIWSLRFLKEESSEGTGMWEFNSLTACW